MDAPQLANPKGILALVNYKLVLGALSLLVLLHLSLPSSVGFERFSVLQETQRLRGGITYQEPPHAIPEPDGYIAMCLAVRNQSRDLPEFFTHHYYHLNISHFYIMDDRSVPPMEEERAPNDWGVPRSAVTFRYYSPVEDQFKFQNLLYDECIRHYGRRHQWMAFIDADEFFEVVDNTTTLEEILRGMEDLCSLKVNWQIHNSHGLLKRPESVRKSFTSCLDDTAEGGWEKNRHVKSIVNTAHYDHAEDPHFFACAGGLPSIGEKGDLVAGSVRPEISRDKIALHHYAVKSKEEYDEKMNRGNAWHVPGTGHTNNWPWDYINGERHNITCDSLASYDP